MAGENTVSVTREELQTRYRELLIENPLLSRIEGKLHTLQWTEEEIRTMQLLIACKSNANLMQRIKELELRLTLPGKPA